MRLSVDESPNGESLEPRVFQERGAPRIVTHVLRARGGKDVWCPVIAVEAQGKTVPALARKVDDSGDGTCYLVTGGRWGVRLKDPTCLDPWQFPDPHQWGEPFLLLPADGADLQFSE